MPRRQGALVGRARSKPVGACKGRFNDAWGSALTLMLLESELARPASKWDARLRAGREDQKRKLDDRITPAKTRYAEADKAALYRAILENIRQNGAPDNMATLIATLVSEGNAARVSEGRVPYSGTTIRAALHRFGIAGTPGRKRKSQKTL